MSTDSKPLKQNTITVLATALFGVPFFLLLASALALIVGAGNAAGWLFEAFLGWLFTVTLFGTLGFHLYRLSTGNGYPQKR